MTVAVNDTIERYTITGTGPYAYTWRIFNDTDLKVYALSAAVPPVPVLLAKDTHYTVAGVNESSGGTITLTAAAYPTYSGYTLDIRPNTPRDQPTSIRNQSRFLPEIHEDAFDYLDRQIQDLGRLVDASVRAPDYEPPLSLTLPLVDARKNLYPVFDLNGQLTVSSGTGADAGLRTDLARTTAGFEGALLVGFRGALAASVARTALAKMRDVVDVRDFGTVDQTGVADSTAAFLAAAASGAKYIVVPDGNIKTTSSIPIAAGQRWFHNNTNFVMAAGGTHKVYTATAVNDWSLGGRWTVTGDNATNGATAGTAAALDMSDCSRYDVRGLIVIQSKGWGIRIRPGSSTTNRAEKGVIQFQAHGCYIGFETEAGTGAEYAEFEAPIITRCATGAKVAAGNTKVTGGSISDNTVNIVLLAGSNHLHSEFNGVAINHGVTAIYADGVTGGTITLGHWFRNCLIFQGILHWNHCFGIVCDNCTVDVDAYRFEETDGCGFRGCTFPGTYANAISNDYNASHSWCFWEDCKNLSGQPYNGALGSILGIRSSATMAASQVLSAANVNATADIKLDTKAIASANNASQTVVAYLAAYNTATGIATVVKGGKGKAPQRAQLVITCNAADAQKFQVFLTHSTLGDFYASMTPIGAAATATTWIATWFGELPVSLAETMKLRITGSGVANNITVSNSGGTKWQVEGL